MTAPRGPIVFNNSTGSDTAASGLGPATAVTGTTGSCTASSNVVTGIDTTGVQVGDLFWGDTSTGRQFSIIASVDSGSQVTLDDNLAATHSGNLTWAIGGKRATLDNADSRQIRRDFKDLWVFHLEHTGTNYQLSSVFDWVPSPSASYAVRLIGTGGIVTVEQTANTSHFTNGGSGGSGGSNFFYENLRLICTNATKTAANGIGYNDGGNPCIINCILGSDTSSERLNCGASRFSSSETRTFTLCNCHVINTVGNGLGAANINQSFEIHACHIRDCGGRGVHAGDGAGSIYMFQSIVEGCASDGVRNIANSRIVIINSTIHGNGGDGVRPFFGGSFVVGLVLYNNNITANGGYGVNCGTSQDRYVALADYNNYGTGATANTSGARNNLTAGANDLAVDPQYADAGSSDFAVGENVKAKGLPLDPDVIGSTGGTGTLSYVDIGAAQREEPAGGGGPKLGAYESGAWR